jgi:hypothetical protein
MSSTAATVAKSVLKRSRTTAFRQQPAPAAAAAATTMTTRMHLLGTHQPATVKRAMTTMAGAGFLTLTCGRTHWMILSLSSTIQHLEICSSASAATNAGTMKVLAFQLVAMLSKQQHRRQRRAIPGRVLSARAHLRL